MLFTKNSSREVVVITGASAGVGRATVREFAKRGAKIGLLARGVEGLEGARREVVELGGEALVLQVDVSEPGQVFEAAKKVEEAFGPIDVWINNAMTSIFAPFDEISPEEFKRVTEVTYLGYVYGTMAALKTMKERNKGHIIQVGSALSYRSIPLQSAYCGAKHAINGFTESIRTELLNEKSKVKISLVQMPAFNTPQFRWVLSRLPNKPQPVPPIFQPEVGARAIAWTADHPRREVKVGWPTVKAIWGDKLAPNFADHYLARFGIEGQQTNEPDSHNRAINLWEPVPGDHGARGVFTARSKSFSWEFWFYKNRWSLAGAALLGTLSLFGLRGSERKKFDNVAPQENEGVTVYG